jgi:DNA-binding response OmpR family regulator
MAKRILLVDDERDLIEMVTFRLEAAGYQVIKAFDGQEALNKAKKEKPDLIILDLMLPKMDGCKVCGLLKSDARYNKIPIIIFTARAQESDQKTDMEIGANAYITKPFDSNILMAKIKELAGG